jgi:hypothetical protein
VTWAQGGYSGEGIGTQMRRTAVLPTGATTTRATKAGAFASQGLCHKENILVSWGLGSNGTQNRVKQPRLNSPTHGVLWDTIEITAKSGRTHKHPVSFRQRPARTTGLTIGATSSISEVAFQTREGVAQNGLAGLNEVPSTSVLRLVRRVVTPGLTEASNTRSTSLHDVRAV